MKQRLHYIDQLKGFAILLVVVGHVIEWCFNETSTSLLYRIIYSFHMPLFAFMSGFVFRGESNFMESLKKFGKQTERLMLPFLVVGLIYSYSVLHLNYEAFFQHLYKQGYWYLLFLLQCYLLTHIYHIFIGKRFENKLNLSIVSDLIFLCIIFVLLRFVPKFTVISQIIGFYHLFHLYPFFFVGYMVKKTNASNRLFSNSYNLSDISFIVYIIMFIGSYYWKPTAVKQLLLAALAIFPIICLFYKKRNIQSYAYRVLETFGRYSLEIYVFHYFLIQNCNMTIMGDYIKISGNHCFEILVSLIISLIIAYICVLASSLIHESKILSFLLLGNRK